ncbi:hypothetical protein OG401_29590 [Kitasatospora purpeofusca]|uniref:hypothetical protein n=1 Tax=Kitasatospora purpeofusca TaxID=67352 RepID=UPI002251107A|nr:hypothetical protein [Kitasatospora purpeofusca]MCX4688403.1 hypothetical protein [Kitasatospora purpeofusca]
MNRSLRLVVAAVCVPILSALAAALVCWPIHGGPLGPQLLIFGLILATGISAGLPACLTWLTPDNPDVEN